MIETEQRSVWRCLRWRQAAWLPVPLLSLAVLVLARFDVGGPMKPHALLSVRDSGIGSDPACQDRLFRNFNRLHTADEHPGAGVGLAVCKKIIERQGGRIWVGSEPGTGATVYFNFPALEPLP